MATRKRRAPGASPQIQQQSNFQQANVYPTTQDSNLSSEQYLANWDGSNIVPNMNSAYPDTSMYDTSAYSNVNSAVGAVPQESNSTQYTGQLVRRNTNQQLAAPGRTPWDAFDGDAGGGQQAGWDNTDDDDELEQKALLARKDAQAKRKQIPPFVQKLSSFLDDNKNTNLIRWSDDGNSFIVLDEDEFARTLIPELFKHNNYASFVRQLNMYGFHKKVGLSDNSMKASETKAKAPSEYFNKYFKRGRPELLWLIQKPKNPATNPKRKRDDDAAKQGDSDDEGRRYANDPGGNAVYAGGEDNVAVLNQEMAMIPRTEYNSLKSEVRALQQQQKIISNVLNRIRQQNDQLYQQATAFQTLHDRHENSINAILTFLATFYNRSLEGQNGVNIADMFAAGLNQNVQPQGNVVDMDEFPEKNISKSPQMTRAPRRPLALLPAPNAKDQAATPTERIQTAPPSARSTASPTVRTQSIFKPAAPSKSSSAGTIPPKSRQMQAEAGSPAVPVKVDAESPSMSQIPENDEIMSAIQNANATQSQNTQNQQLDFSQALSHFQNAGGNLPLTPQQRNDMLLSMANDATAASPNRNIAGGNNALVTPQPPAVPSLDGYVATQAQLDLLQKMSDDQGNRVQNLQERLQPLSPSGSIPGLANGNSYFNNLGEPGAYDLDLDSFVNSDYEFNNPQAGVGGNSDLPLPDLNFELPENGDMSNGLFEHSSDIVGQGFGDGAQYGNMGSNSNGGRVESVSSTATSPATVEEHHVEEQRTTRSPKRRRKAT